MQGTPNMGMRENEREWESESEWEWESEMDRDKGKARWTEAIKWTFLSHTDCCWSWWSERRSSSIIIVLSLLMSMSMTTKLMRTNKIGKSEWVYFRRKGRPSPSIYLVETCGRFISLSLSIFTTTTTSFPPCHRGHHRHHRHRQHRHHHHHQG